MKKILFVITQFYKGGAEVALLNLFKSLPQKEFEVDFLIFDQMILRDAQSLISEIPSWINVCNAAEKEGRLAVVRKAWYKVYRKLTKHQLYRKSAYAFVKGKVYDAAFSYGEWMSPEFIAKKVTAREKWVWIHADVDKASYVDDKILFGYDQEYKGYIFVSNHSCRDAVNKFPFLAGKCTVVHNMCNDKEIRQQAEEELRDLAKYKKPWLLSVANLREEKNYPRMVEAMKCLQERNVDITWLCIGSTANPFLFNKVEGMIKDYGLQDTFVLLGTQKNPYKYMRQSKAVLVLSDFEAWSLVITEAKLLGIPVIATKTSGALEQIINEETGLLVEFEPEQIADVIERLLKDTELQQKLQHNLHDFSTSQQTLNEFYRVLGE